MKKACIFLMCLLLCGCKNQKTADELREPYENAAKITCTAQIEAQSSPCVTYTLSFLRENGDRIEILAPESVCGISAEIKQKSAQISYKDVSLDALLPLFRGLSPCDALTCIFDDLRSKEPCAFFAEKGMFRLDFSESDGENEIYKSVYLDENSAFCGAEVCLNGVMLLKITPSEFSLF